MGLPLIQLLAEVDVESGQASFLVACFAIALLFAAGALKCGFILARPQAHKLCVASLMVLTLTLAYFFVVAAFRDILVLPKWGAAVTGLICLAGFTGAWITSIIGLFDYRGRSEQYDQGRGQAWLALVGSTIPLGLIAVVIAFGVVQEARGLAERNGRTPSSEAESAAGDAGKFAKEESKADAFGNVASVDDATVHRVSHEVEARSSNPKTTQHFRELNFEFTPPESGWIKLHAPSVSADAVVAYTSKAPQMLFFIIAEQLGADVEVETDALLEVIKSRIFAGYDDVEFDEPTPQSVAGIKGVSINVTYTEGAADHRRSMWIGTQGGFLFQLITTGRAKHADRLDERHRQMLAGFRVIDQGAMVYSQGRSPIAKFESKDYGYEIDLSGASWLQAPDELEILPAAEAAATLKNCAAVAVVPLYLPHDGAALDDVATVLAGALIEGLNADARQNVDIKPADAHGVEEMSFGYQDTSAAGAAIEYRMRVLRQGRHVVMAVGLTPREEVDALAAIEQAVATLRFTGEGHGSNEVGSDQQRAGRGSALNSLGFVAFEQHDLELSLACFAEAIKLQPTSPTPLLNYAHVLSESGKLEQAIVEVETRIDQYEEKQRLQEKLAALLFDAGDVDRCAETLKRLLSEGYRSEETLAILTGVYIKQEKYDEALAAIDEYLKGGASQQATQIKAVLLSKIGDHDGAIAILEEVRKLRPRDPASVINLAVAYAEAERYDEALNLTQQLLDQGKSTEEVHLVRGRCELGKKLYREAKESFERALAANPRSQDAQEAIAIASAMLGQGNNSIVKTPIEPVPLPEEIAGRLTQMSPDDRVAGAFGAYEHFRVVGYDYRQGERWRSTTYRKIKIIGQEGVDRFSTITVTFNPLSERLFVNRLAVYDAAGNLATEGNANDYYVVADAKSDLATGDSTLTIPVPQLQPGNTLEYTLTREQLAVDEFGYEEVLLTSSIPVQAAAAFVVGDVDKLAHTSSGPEPRAAAAGGLFWGVSEPAVYVDESSQPPITEFLPVIHLADIGQQWPAIGNEYATKIADRLELDAVTTAKAAELTQGLTTPEEKVAILTRFVQKQLNYQGLEFGVRGLIPNSAAKSLEIGYGDCKDHSVLLKQLLNAVGLPAQLTLVNATSEVDGRLPSSAQFDHMIVSIPGPNGGDEGRVFIDCTAKHADPLSVTADDFSGGLALVVEPHASRLVPIPPRTSQGSAIRCSREITVVCDEPERETADAVIREQVSFSDAPAAALRSALVSMQPRDRKDVISRLISEQDAVDVTRLEVLNLEDPVAPLILQLEYRMDNVLHRVGERGTPFSGRIVSPWESWATLAYAMTERLTPFRTTAASIVGSTRYALPDGLMIDRGLETIESSPSNRFFTWRIEVDRASNMATLRIDRRAGSHSAADYSSCALEAKELADRLRRPISISEIPATARAEQSSIAR
jgi:tetratricopeptide (TPR) repeat protein/transglutaminase-like putative cysteine protease